jgi:branched-chain amino acid transport system permease protein
VTGGSNGLFGIPQPALGTTDRALRGNDRFYWYALAVFLVGYGMLRMIVASPFGRALGAIRENEGRMSSLGYNVPLYKLTAFTIAGAVAGYAGALFLQQPKYFSPEGMSFEVSALAVVALIVGGQRSLLGPVLGAAFVYVIRDQLASVLAEHWRLVLGAVFVLVVYLLPGGFVAAGRAARRRVAARGAA